MGRLKTSTYAFWSKVVSLTFEWEAFWSKSRQIYREVCEKFYAYDTSRTRVLLFTTSG